MRPDWVRDRLARERACLRRIERLFALAICASFQMGGNQLDLATWIGKHTTCPPVCGRLVRRGTDLS